MKEIWYQKLGLKAMARPALLRERSSLRPSWSVWKTVKLWKVVLSSETGERSGGEAAVQASCARIELWIPLLLPDEGERAKGETSRVGLPGAGVTPPK